MNRLVAKLGSVRAVCLTAMVLSLCAAVFVQPDNPTWCRIFEAGFFTLLGNYTRQSNAQPPPGKRTNEP